VKKPDKNYDLFNKNKININNEKSFFDDKSYYNIESSKKSQNDSSNPEKEFNM
jgi:hypothetical protein